MSTLEVPSADGEELWETHFSLYWYPSVIAADELGVLRSLAEEPATPEELAARLGLNLRALSAVLSMLAALGHLVPREGRFCLTDVGRHYLLPDSPFYWGGIFDSGRRTNPIYQRLRKVMVTPDPTDPMPVPEAAEPAERVGNADHWAAGDVGSEHARQTARYMQSNALALAITLAKNCDFSAARRLLDVGGGSGCFSIALADRYPELSCTIFDLPASCGVAREYVEGQGLTGRVDTYEGDMFRDAWPTGYDSMLFSNVLHDWRIDTCALLLRRAYEAMEPGGTINLHELLLNDDASGPKSAAGLSVMMVVATQGQQFTYAQLRELLEGAGFTDVSYRPVAKRALVRARKPLG